MAVVGSGVGSVAAEAGSGGSKWESGCHERERERER